ncbi:MAG: hypothetical protein M1817_001850 [Caeruleum heppii]|nr:MAG: hypothetical protein M1817_001850 [Caeruleum heppii]
MALFWVQYWGYLPQIVEEPMGDGSTQGGRVVLDQSSPDRLPAITTSEPTQPYLASDNSSREQSHRTSPAIADSTRAPFDPQPFFTQGLPESYNRSQSRGPARSGAFDMSAMTTSLMPEYRYDQRALPSPQQQRYPTGPSTSALVYQLQQISQFAGQTALNQQQNNNWNMQYPQQFSNYVQQGQQAVIPAPGPHHYPQPYQLSPYAPNYGPGQAAYTDPAWALQQPQAMPFYYPGTNMSHPASSGQMRFGPHSAPYSRRSSFPHGQGALRRPGQVDVYGQQQYLPDVRTGGYSGTNMNVPYLRSGSVPASTRRTEGPSLTALQPSMPRGPPRKPKQSGYALWVGNLPPGTNVMDLKEHFSREATSTIESVFLISKSNCAFVNYKTEEACAAAMSRFHDSRFQGVRLVCRLRRSSASPAPGVPTGPAAATAAGPQRHSAPAVLDEVSVEQARETGGSMNSPKKEGALTKVKEKFFVVKSLTVEDLDLSVRNGIWATQAHNEAALNAAYESADNVYLFFSANKSGEYFGYARMTSPINEESSATIDWAPATTNFEETDLPKAIPTAATECAPKGRIIDDSARGTIFWEADSDDQRDESRAEEATSSKSGEDEAEDGSSFNKAWGKPFRVEWLSTTRLPFYRTRGLRNPWNANREVKIARDGTELETTVGRRLLQMFHRALPSPGLEPPHGGGPHTMPAIVGGMMPQMRPPF